MSWDEFAKGSALPVPAGLKPTPRRRRPHPGAVAGGIGARAGPLGQRATAAADDAGRTDRGRPVAPRAVGGPGRVVTSALSPGTRATPGAIRLPSQSWSPCWRTPVIIQ